jgi:hypothetical protein
MVEEPTTEPLPPRILLDDPIPLISWIEASSGAFQLDGTDLIQMWGLVALAALSREGADRRLMPSPTHGTTTGSRFAHAVGFFDAVRGQRAAQPGEGRRTVKLNRFRDFGEIEPLASSLTRLLIDDPELEDTRLTLYYVLNELLRNVVQHSGDPLGGIVGAQRNAGERPVIQVAVADSGIGIEAHLRRTHPALANSEEALERSLWPHFSGTFEEGLSGSPMAQNAGMGLFFIAEMAKRTVGRLLIASRGATLLLQGNPDDPKDHQIRFLRTGGRGFPGTLVVFELPVNEVQDYRGLIEVINELAKARSPKHALHRWLRYEAPPTGVPILLASATAENTEAAERLAREEIEPRLFRQEPVALDFRGVSVCTQSYLHSLLYRSLRVAWALQVPIFVLHADAAVKSSLALLESYALGG